MDLRRRVADKFDKLRRLATSSNVHEAALAAERADELETKYALRPQYNGFFYNRWEMDRGGYGPSNQPVITLTIPPDEFDALIEQEFFGKNTFHQETDDAISLWMPVRLRVRRG